LAWLIFRPAGEATFPVPVPNGYDDFLEAVERIGPSQPPAGSWDREPDPEEIRAWMLDHAEAFDLVRRGIGKECGVPLRASSDWIREHGALLGPRQGLTHCLVARAEFARSDERMTDMFEAYVDAYRYAQQGFRRGLSIDYLCQVSAEARVLQSLTLAVGGLDPQRAGVMLELLERGKVELEEPGLVLRRTRNLARAISGPGATLRAWGRMWNRMIRKAIDTRSWAPLLMTDLRVLKASRDRHRKAVDAVCARLREVIAAGSTPAVVSGGTTSRFDADGRGVVSPGAASGRE
jgi:hypothetical protein